MIIYVRKHEGNYEFRVTIPGHSENMQYSVPISGTPSLGPAAEKSRLGLIGTSTSRAIGAAA
jgi:hypothetical protein